MHLEPINEKIILTETGNALEYFSKCFGPNPYKALRSAFRPGNTGRSFAILVTLLGMNDLLVPSVFIGHLNSSVFLLNNAAVSRIRIPRVLALALSPFSVCRLPSRHFRMRCSPGFFQRAMTRLPRCRISDCYYYTIWYSVITGARNDLQFCQ